MNLNLYRRHGARCSRGHAPFSQTYEPDELRRIKKPCYCPIYASGTLAGQFKRKNTECTAWDEAKALTRTWEDADSWDGPAKVEKPAAPVPVPTPAPAPAAPEGITVERAINTFKAEFQEHAAANTQKKYGLLLKKLKTFSDEHGLATIDQWGPINVREFRSSWSVSPQTAAKSMSTVKAFFEFCLCNEWIKRNPARLVKNQRGRDAADRRNEQKLPFSDAELQRMYNACETKYGKQEVKWSRAIHSQQVSGEYARYNYKWTGQDLADFISVSVYTGLRISDVSTFHIDRMQQTGEIHVRTTKAGTHVYTWVPEWLQERIRARAHEYGPYIFGEHRTKDMNVVTDVWRRKLIKLWTLCERPDFKWSATPTPHRFRHTFARVLLSRPGVSVRDVAELLGNTEQMVRKHYAAWIPERQERLTAVLKAAFAEKPKPKVIEMPKTGTK
jgi:integrase